MKNTQKHPAHYAKAPAAGNTSPTGWQPGRTRRRLLAARRADGGRGCSQRLPLDLHTSPRTDPVFAASFDIRLECQRERIPEVSQGLTISKVMEEVKGPLIHGRQVCLYVCV